MRRTGGQAQLWTGERRPGSAVAGGRVIVPQWEAEMCCLRYREAAVEGTGTEGWWLAWRRC